MPIVRVNHCVPILNIYKRMGHIYSTENNIHHFVIGYMINPSLHINNVFRTKVQKCLGCYFSIETIKTIRDCLMKNNTSIMELIMIYETVGMAIRKVYIVLSCVVYNIIDNYVCINYLSCQSKILCNISKNSTFKETNFNLLLGIGIPELSLNLVSCHGFMLKPNSIVILNCRSRLINNYLSKVFFIIDWGSKQLNLIPNDVILIINLVDQLKTDYVMVKNEALSAISNILIKICI